MPVTLEDIARRAGVSRSTVSRAIKDQGRMSVATRKRIKQLAREMGYVPNFLAQSLHETRTSMIGVVITDVSDPFIWNVIEGIEQVADDSGYTIFLGASKYQTSKELELIEKFYQRRVDGIIVLTSHLGSLRDSRLEQIDIPIVVVNAEENRGNFSTVSIDDRSEARRAIEYLISLGHRDIAFVGSTNRPLSSNRRLDGYKLALRTASIPIIDEHIFHLPVHSDYEAGQQVLVSILDARASAVFCYNDMIAIGLINACREHNVLIPDQLSIMGFDDIEQTQQIYPSLTTVHQPKIELGKTAMDTIRQHIDEIHFVHKVLRCKLVIRESTCPAS